MIDRNVCVSEVNFVCIVVMMMSRREENEAERMQRARWVNALKPARHTRHGKAPTLILRI